MEGMNNEKEQIDTEERQENIIEEKDIEELPKNNIEKKKGRKAPFIVGIIIGLVIGFVLFSPYLLDLFATESETQETQEPEIPIYENYTMYESEDIIIYKNENLNLQVTVKYYYSYEGYLYNIDYNADENGYEIVSIKYSPDELFSAILLNAESLTDLQIKWFNHTCKKILPIRHYEVSYFEEDLINFFNGELEVSIWYHGSDLGYNSSWTYNGSDKMVLGDTLDELFNNIYNESDNLSNYQLQWFEFMCKDELS